MMVESAFATDASCLITGTSVAVKLTGLARFSDCASVLENEGGDITSTQRLTGAGLCMISRFRLTVACRCAYLLQRTSMRI